MRSVKTTAGRPSCTLENPRQRFGAHMSIAGGMHRALEEALRLRCNTVQVFVKNQRQWRAPALKPHDVERWHELLATPGFGPAVAHATYLINLASPDGTVLARSRAALADELQRCDVLRIPYLVLHPGAAMGAPVAVAIRRVAESLNRIFARRPDCPTMVLLESTAGQGSSLGRTFEELAEIIARVENSGRVGVCFDTCHLFAAGYDIRRLAMYESTLARAARSVGLDRIRCWHLNDSRTKLGSHVDRHEHIGHGCIGVGGFRNVVGDDRFRGVPMILETPKGTNPNGQEWDAVNLRRLRGLAARSRLPAAPSDHRPGPPPSGRG